MRRSILIAIVGMALGLGGCSTPPPAPEFLTPEQAVLQAANSAPAGVPGTFSLLVLGSGPYNEFLYLDSQKDYRDQRNLAIEFAPSVSAQLRQLYGEDPLTFFIGKRIAVAGTAFRVQINLIVNQKATGLYYYQTHIHVVDAAQIRLLP